MVSRVENAPGLGEIAAEKVATLMKRVTAGRILVVAQSVGDVRILWEAISDHVPGTTVLWCRDAVSALALAQDLATPPDVIVLHAEISWADDARVVQQVRSIPTLVS